MAETAHRGQHDGGYPCMYEHQRDDALRLLHDVLAAYEDGGERGLKVEMGRVSDHLARVR